MCMYFTPLIKPSSLPSDLTPLADRQGGGWVTVPGGVQETFRWCTKEHGLVRQYGVVDGWLTRWSWLDDLGSCFQPWWFYDAIRSWLPGLKWLNYVLFHGSLSYEAQHSVKLSLLATKASQVNSSNIGAILRFCIQTYLEAWGENLTTSWLKLYYVCNCEKCM